MKCGECDYFNQCTASYASSYFTAETCVPFCPQSSNAICEDYYDPVKCGDCEYDNLCLASAASDGEFNPKTCDRVCPESSSDVVCIAEYDPVQCGKGLRCEYDNQCLATAASKTLYCRELQKGLSSSIFNCAYAL